MRSVHTRPRLLLYLLPLLMIAGMATSVGAQGLFGAGLPSFGGILGGATGCGEKLCPNMAAPNFYIGWMEDRQGTSFSADPIDVGGSSIQHHYPNRGLWLGLSESFFPGDRLSFIASGWYLVPSKTSSRETYPPFPENLASVTWDTDTQWWFVDGVCSFGSPSGLSLLAGLRYDYFTTRFKNPVETLAIVGSRDGDTADVTSEGWIPLFGTQCAYTGAWGSLLARVVGVPTLLGNVKYQQTLFSGDRVKARGNWTNGYFLEFFSEYSKKLGPGTLGLFGRWNLAQGKSNVSLEIAPIIGSNTYHLTLNRYSWTFGASFSIPFDTPM